MKKNNPTRRAGQKIILLQFCPKNIFWPGPKTQPPAPPPEYQLDRALGRSAGVTHVVIIRIDTTTVGEAKEHTF